MQAGSRGSGATDTRPARTSGIADTRFAGAEVRPVIAEGDRRRRRTDVGRVGGEALCRAQVILHCQRHRQIEKLRTHRVAQCEPAVILHRSGAEADARTAAEGHGVWRRDAIGIDDVDAERNVGIERRDGGAPIEQKTTARAERERSLPTPEVRDRRVAARRRKSRRIERWARRGWGVGPSVQRAVGQLEERGCSCAWSRRRGPVQ